MNQAPGIRPLHLHTVESLCRDLVSSREVGVGAGNQPFSLPSAHARSVLQWYVGRSGRWGANLTTADCDAIVDSLDTPPQVFAEVSFAAKATPRRLKLVGLRAHRFAGLHRYGTATIPPDIFVVEIHSDLTLLEGANGAGKTSVLNAVVWALTGQLLRPQRPPESGMTAFNCELEPQIAGGQAETIGTLPVVPLPDLQVERPSGLLHVDTWVELSFVDEAGQPLPPVRRELCRTSRGKVEESLRGLDTLGVDPVGLRSGTVMAALLPYIQIGSASELGQAVAELTGLAPLALLAKHANKTIDRLSGEFTRSRQEELRKADAKYNEARADLLTRVKETPSMGFDHPLPLPSGAQAEEELETVRQHFEQLGAGGLKQAQEVLGEGFNPQVEQHRRDLSDSIVPALGEVEHIRQLPSARRLAELGAVKAESRDAARNLMAQVLEQGSTLVRLARDPSRAARLRLYAAISAWMHLHPEAAPPASHCPVCATSLEGLIDPITGESVQSHLEQAGQGDAALVAQTMQQWAKAAANHLTAALPASLQAELQEDLPEHPCELLRATLGRELWNQPNFKGVLAALDAPMKEKLEARLTNASALPNSTLPDLSQALPGLTDLQAVLRRLDTALRFGQWRSDNAAFMQDIFLAVVGRRPSEQGMPNAGSLYAQLLQLQDIVSSVEPIRQGVALCQRMKTQLTTRKALLARIERYRQAQAALHECAQLGALAESQVGVLQLTLEAAAREWRDRVYQGAFPARHLALVRHTTETGGRLAIQVGAGGVSAPAQHVSNASALRASLIGFYLAYWLYLQRERGGLRLLLLDDPQDLLDGDNRHRLADALALLAKDGAKLLVTTHDKRLAQWLVQACRHEQVTLDHRMVHPPYAQRPTLQTTPSVIDLQAKFAATEGNPNDPHAAREYASECRVFIEGRLADLFDDGAYPAATATTFKAPTLMDHVGRLRAAVNTPSNELYRSAVLKKLATHPALAERAATLKLLNQAHHADKLRIQPSDVAACRMELAALCKLVDRAHEDFRLYLRREKLPRPFGDLTALAPATLPAFSVPIRPNLRAFVRGAAVGASQEAAVGTVDQTLFEGRSFFFLRTTNFGFASTVESVAVVESIPSAVADRQLVIARRGTEVYARRLLRPDGQDVVALASETPDPRHSRPTLLFHEREVALHKVVGMFFHVGRLAPRGGTEEAVQIDGTSLIERIQSAYKVEDQSAIPLALPGQIALGGPSLSPADFDAHREQYAALHLDDGTSLFKRVGEKLPAALGMLRQFDPIGGLGVADVLAVGGPSPGLRAVEQAVLVLGVLYAGV